MNCELINTPIHNLAHLSTFHQNGHSVGSGLVVELVQHKNQLLFH